MKTVNAREVIIAPFGMFVNRAIKITCGNCKFTFKDKPAVAKNMVSKCPFCNSINELPITKI
jgi:hypothetical protein